MTNTDLQKAQLVMFAARHAGPKATLDQMKGICYCIRERVRAGWNDGKWMDVLQAAEENAPHHFVAIHENLDGSIVTERREFQMLLRDVDDIFYSQKAGMSEMPNSLESSIEQNREKYWCFLNRARTPWFDQHIVGDQKNHPNRTQAGLMMFYE